MNDILEKLNDSQKEAVLSEDKYVLILAGAGTGKTRAITARIIHLIKNKNINPRNILAVTFTNKAANEMKERVFNYLNKDIDIMIRTFHSFGAYILRQEAFAVGRSFNFQIYDDDDSKKAINEVLKKIGFEKSMNATVKKWMQTYKQNLEEYSKMQYQNEEFKQVYKNYNDYLLKSNCFDFEDLIFQPVKVFTNYPKILEKYQNRFKYILIDEYQDTNKSQFELVKLFTGLDNKVMVVGDEDQSIYKFRGADINNILNFEKDFQAVKIIRMEQNYRSTNNILNTANKLISNNTERLGKNLYSKKAEGKKIILFSAEDEIDEVNKVLYFIDNKHLNLNDTAILYRTNNQSRPFEQVFNKLNIPYILIGAIRFFEREEIKDAISILKWLVNTKDKIAFYRFINKPSRGIGDKSLDVLIDESVHFDNDLYLALQNAEKINGIPKKAKEAINKIAGIFSDKEKILNNEPLDKVLTYYLDKLGMIEFYKEKDAKENTERLDNINELVKSLADRGIGVNAVMSFLEEVTLSATTKENNYYGKIKLMTIHNAKGLEFENVFITGLETDLFPHINSMDDDAELEEERRLFYVAITRAENNLFLSYCHFRNIMGFTKNTSPSFFIEELPENLLELKFIDSYSKTSQENYKAGDIVKHKDYGKGKIIKITKNASGKSLALVDFWDSSMMEFILEFTKFERVE